MLARLVSLTTLMVSLAGGLPHGARPSSQGGHGLARRALSPLAVATRLIDLTVSRRAEAAEEEPGAASGAHTRGEQPAPGGHGAAGAEVAEGGEAHAPALDLGKLALQLLNFAVLLFILVKFGGGAMSKMLGARHEQLKSDLASAAALRAAAEAKLVKQEERLARLEGEILSLRQSIRAEAEADKQRLMAAASERGRRIQAETTFLVEQQVREAEVKLRRESAEAALAIAETLLRRAVGPTDQQTFLDKFIADSEASSPKSGAATAVVPAPVSLAGTPTPTLGGAV